MIAQRLRVSNFKRVVETEVPLSSITAIVGGNNSGKSCILQAPHFAVGLMQSTSINATSSLPIEKLRYQPTGDILDLAFGGRLTVDGAPVEVTFTFDEDVPFHIRLRRGEGATVLVESDDNDAILAALSDVDSSYTVYVPGLAGIPLREEYRSDAVVSNALARGDANLYLRNILLRINNDERKLAEFNQELGHILNDAALRVSFNQQRDLLIDVRIETDGLTVPLDAVGTGVLQYIQIIAYTINYRPKLLLLDEPDAHLHPNNQRMVALALKRIADRGDTRVILTTHSRTLLDALSEIQDASVVWMEAGAVQPERSMDRISMLMALGALEGAERFYSDDRSAVLFTEDTDIEHLKIMLEANGVDQSKILIQSYSGSARLQAALILARWARELKPGVRVIVHRDRDFMTDDEVADLRKKYEIDGSGIELFVTQGSDIEWYFTSPQHLSKTLGIDSEAGQRLVDECLAENSNLLFDKFRSKRDMIKGELYKDDTARFKSAIALAGKGPIKRDHAMGKLLLGQIVDHLQNTLKVEKAALMRPTDALMDASLRSLGESLERSDVVAEVIRVES